MSNNKENLKERIDQRKTEAEEIQKVHEQLLALRAIHREENAAFAAKRSNLSPNDQKLSELTPPSKPSP
jgi:hypothetical protein